jgi:hypothetical protein
MERNLREDLDVKGRIVLTWILMKYGWVIWTGFIWVRTGATGMFS